MGRKAYEAEHLAFDSTWWGVEAVRLKRVESEVALEQADRDFRLSGVRLVYYYCGSEDLRSSRLVQAHGYKLVDIRIDMERATAANSATLAPMRLDSDYVIRLAEFSDTSRLRELAAQNHRGSRFYNDGRFPRQRCDELYAHWIESDVRDRGGTVFVAANSSGAVGYAACKVDGESARVGLLGVDAMHRQRGLAARLLDALIGAVRSVGVQTIRSATQGANVGSLRTHERGGFTTTAVGLWHHKWFDTSVAS